MASIAPYSKPKPRLLNKMALKFKTHEGSFIYAPVKGEAVQDKRKIIVTTSKGYRHYIYGAKLTSTKHVVAGQRIGRALGKRVVYKRVSPNGKTLDPNKALNRKGAVTPKKWMPGANRVESRWPAGQMGPGDERVAGWHTSESPHDEGAIRGVANYVNQKGWPYTILWNPYTGQFIQMYPADVAARAFQNDGNYPTNRHGKIRIQICVIGRAADAPLKNSPMKGRRELMEWLDSWGIPRELTVDYSRSRKEWEKSGHTSHRSAPGNSHTDPGPIDVDKLFAP